ncbi:MAG TPA: universal stress protein [Candidatus Obscuribacterales bacterium]
MNPLTLLLAINGSETSLHAANLCFALAKAAGAEVILQHVINTEAARQLLPIRKPGLIGSGLHLQVYEDLISSLRNVAEKLTTKCEALALGHGIDMKTFIDEGDCLQAILQRSAHCDLTVIGHSSLLERTLESPGAMPRFIPSLAEQLVRAVRVPLLIVNGPVDHFNEGVILSSATDVNLDYLRACKALLTALGLKTRISFIADQLVDAEKSTSEAIEKFLHDCPDLHDVSFDLREIRGETAGGPLKLWQRAGEKVNIDCKESTLLIVPTRCMGPNSLTIFGAEPEQFVAELDLPAVLIYPEDNVLSQAPSRVRSFTQKLSFAVEPAALPRRTDA